MRLLPKNKKIKLIALLFGLITIIEGILWYFMPLYFESKLNNLLLVGILISAHPLASLLTSIPAGDLCDKISRKFVFILGAVGFTASFILLLVGTFESFLFFMILYGVFSTMYGISAFVYVIDHSRPNLIGESAGFFNFVQYLGWLLGSLIAGFLLIILEVSFMLKMLLFFLILFCALSLWFFPSKKKIKMRDFTKSESVLAKDGIFIKEIKSISKFGKPLIAMLAFSFAFGFWEYAIWTFEPIYVREIGGSLLAGAGILCLISLPGAISAFVSGKLTNIFGTRKLINLGILFILFGQILFILKQNILTLSLALVITSFGALFISVPFNCYQKKYVEKNLRGEVEGSLEMLYNIGGIAGPLTIGIALTLENLSALFYYTSGIFLIAIFMLFLFLKNKDF